MKILCKMRDFYVGLDIKDALFALLAVLILVCVQLAKINNSASDVGSYVSDIKSEIRYK